MIEAEVKKISDRQATLFNLDEYAVESEVKWGWLDEDPKLGTNKTLVPSSPTSELGTNKTLVPNSPTSELGTNKTLVPNFEPTDTWEEKYDGVYLEDWVPPLGCLQQKWVKNCQYWYWRYYDLRGKKRSLYLSKDYNKAVRKVIKIGVPTDAKIPKSSHAKTDPQTQNDPQ